MIIGLKPFSFYSLEVTGYTVAGEGPKSLIIVETPPGGNLVPYKLNFCKYNDNF